jgi:hypothetical protein
LCCTVSSSPAGYGSLAAGRLEQRDHGQGFWAAQDGRCTTQRRSAKLRFLVNTPKSQAINSVFGPTNCTLLISLSEPAGSVDAAVLAGRNIAEGANGAELRSRAGDGAVEVGAGQICAPLPGGAAVAARPEVGMVRESRVKGDEQGVSGIQHERRRGAVAWPNGSQPGLVRRVGEEALHGPMV